MVQDSVGVHEIEVLRWYGKREERRDAVVHKGELSQIMSFGDKSEVEVEPKDKPAGHTVERNRLEPGAAPDLQDAERALEQTIGPVELELDEGVTQGG